MNKCLRCGVNEKEIKKKLIDGEFCSESCKYAYIDTINKKVEDLRKQSEKRREKRIMLSSRRWGG